VTEPPAVAGGRPHVAAVEMSLVLKHAYSLRRSFVHLQERNPADGQLPYPATAGGSVAVTAILAARSIQNRIVPQIALPCPISGRSHLEYRNHGHGPVS
jgi:hypothetical protein